MRHFRDLTYFLFTKFGAEILFHGRISPKYGQKMKSNTAPAAVLNLLPVVISVTWYLWFSAAAHKICCNRTVFGKKRYILIFRYGVYPPSWIFNEVNEVKFYYLDISRIQFHMRVQNSMQRYKISFSTEWQKNKIHCDGSCRLFTSGGGLQLPVKFGISPIILAFFKAFRLFSNMAVIRHISVTYLQFWPLTKSSRWSEVAAQIPYQSNVLLLKY